MLNSERILPTREGRLWNPLDDITTATFYEDCTNMNVAATATQTRPGVFATQAVHPQNRMTKVLQFQSLVVPRTPPEGPGGPLAPDRSMFTTARRSKVV